jgi:16S rRNA (guanine966-N2)-methyltransferase
MRILSGSAKGRPLKSLPKGYELRPILARIRKSLFDILRPRLDGALFLDLFAGIGTVGFEALSNGARRVVFVDAEKSSLTHIQKNAATLGFTDQVDIRAGDATRNLFWLSGQKFDFIFMGPPYVDAEKKPLALTVPALTRIDEANIAGPHTWVIGQHHEKEPIDGIPERWEIFREKEYGDSVLTFFRMKQEQQIQEKKQEENKP